jgi:hypothetical protein
MQAIYGTAIHVRHRVNNNKGDDFYPASTTFYTLFEIDGRKVSIRSRAPQPVSEGDRLAVAGAARNGVFQGEAYKNLTTQVHGSEDWVLVTALGVVVPAMALAAVLAFDVAPAGSWLAMLVSGGYGSCLLRRGVRVWRATRLLGRAIPGSNTAH